MAAPFDLDACLAAHPPWVFAFGGRAWRAERVSAREVERFLERRRQAGADQAKQRRALWWLLRRAFPWRFSFRRYGDPVTIILGLEPITQTITLIDCLRALGGESTVAVRRHE